LDYLKALVHYWRTDFDWRAQEAQLNRLHHYQTPVDGLNIHFIHERGIGPSPMPLVMTHGWPSCFFEMTKILPFLTDLTSRRILWMRLIWSRPPCRFGWIRDGARRRCNGWLALARS
jgi:pimeloyl-ACP methyl ester carboxylesterase